jgi:catalase
MVGQLNFIDHDLAKKVAEKLGVKVKKLEQPNHSIPADANIADLQSEEREPKTKISQALSMKDTVKDTIKSRKIGFIIADGTDGAALTDLKTKLESKGAKVEIIAPSLAPVITDNGPVTPKHSLTSTASVCFDALYIGAGEKSTAALMAPENKHLSLRFINEAYKHCKAIYFGEGTEELYKSSNIAMKQHEDRAVIISKDGGTDKQFMTAIAGHRVWDLEMERNM